MTFPLINYFVILTIFYCLFFHEIQCHREYSEACTKLTKLQSIGAEAGKVMNFFMVFSASKLSFCKTSFNAYPHSVPELSVQ